MVADYDRDGDLDLAVATTDAYRLYENRMDRNRENAVQIRVLDANGSGTGAYGATVTVSRVDGGKTERRDASTGAATSSHRTRGSSTWASVKPSRSTSA